ncbi:MAG TPA: hypothetical protein VFZ09_44300 [Archangium sp.]|uniref:hypothetical protein n=1 Tax=Archangium sp. TaxID=1872627 RepID=UPI002E352CA2|nr:hypothetical protein [Archangium sp.]HEX5753304.1 hypothetical protein [Archangium sp.]
MKSRSRLYVSLCLGGWLLGPAALAQQDPRVVIVKPSAGAKAPAQAKRYWADYASNSIKRSNLDGSNVETLATDTEGPYATTYDPETGYVLWTSSGDELVQMAPANGATGSTITLNSSFEEYFPVIVKGTDLNVAYGVVEGQVVRVTEDKNTGTEKRDVLYTLSSAEDVHGLALTPDGKGLYLGDLQGRMTRKLNLSTLQVTPLVYDNGETCTLCLTSQPTSSTSTKKAAPAPRSSASKEKK